MVKQGLKFRCFLCDAQFTDTKQKTRHMRKVHDPLLCRWCDADFQDGSRLRNHVRRVHPFWKGQGSIETISRRLGTPAEVEPERPSGSGARPDEYIPGYVPQYVPTPKRKAITTPPSEESDWDEEPEGELVIDEPARQPSSSPPRKVVPLNVYKDRHTPPVKQPVKTDQFDQMGRRVAEIARYCSDQGEGCWDTMKSKLESFIAVSEKYPGIPATASTEASTVPAPGGCPGNTCVS